MGNKEQGRERMVEMLRRNGLVVAGNFFQKKESLKSPTGADGTRQSSTYWWRGNSSSGE